MDPVGVSNAGGNFNSYWYANNNPYTFVDPDGMYACPKDDTSCANERKSEPSSKEKESEQPRNRMGYRTRAGYVVGVIQVSGTGSAGNPASPIAARALADGHITLKEANSIWRNNNDPDFEVTVDAAQLTVRQLSSLVGNNSTAVGVVLGADFAVHGQVTLQMINGNIVILPDRYDFLPHDVSKYPRTIIGDVRNTLTFAGFIFASGLGTSTGTDFTIRYAGAPNVIPP